MLPGGWLARQFARFEAMYAGMHAGSSAAARACWANLLTSLPACQPASLPTCQPTNLLHANLPVCQLTSLPRGQHLGPLRRCKQLLSPPGWANLPTSGLASQTAQ